MDKIKASFGWIKDKYLKMEDLILEMDKKILEETSKFALTLFETDAQNGVQEDNSQRRTQNEEDETFSSAMEDTPPEQSDFSSEEDGDDQVQDNQTRNSLVSEQLHPNIIAGTEETTEKFQGEFPWTEVKNEYCKKPACKKLKFSRRKNDQKDSSSNEDVEAQVNQKQGTTSTPTSSDKHSDVKVDEIDWEFV